MNINIEPRRKPNKSFITAMVLATLLSGVASTSWAVNPKYKPASRAPAPIDITTNAYGYSRNAPDALRIGDTVADFILPQAGGGTVDLQHIRKDGPVVIIFYRGHW